MQALFPKRKKHPFTQNNFWRPFILLVKTFPRPPLPNNCQKYGPHGPWHFEIRNLLTDKNHFKLNFTLNHPKMIKTAYHECVCFYSHSSLLFILWVYIYVYHIRLRIGHGRAKWKKRSRSVVEVGAKRVIVTSPIHIHKYIHYGNNSIYIINKIIIKTTRPKTVPRRISLVSIKTSALCCSIESISNGVRNSDADRPHGGRKRPWICIIRLKTERKQLHNFTDVVNIKTKNKKIKINNVLLTLFHYLVATGFTNIFGSRIVGYAGPFFHGSDLTEKVKLRPGSSDRTDVIND